MKNRLQVQKEVVVEIISKVEVQRIVEANEHDARSALGGGGLDVIGQSHVFFLATADKSGFGILWGRWYGDNLTGEVPLLAGSQADGSV